MTDRREFAAYLDLTVGVTHYRYGSVAAYRSGNWFTSALAAWPAPAEAFADRYGLLQARPVTVAIADTGDGEPVTLAELSGLRGSSAVLDLVSTVVDDGVLLDHYTGSITDEAGAEILDEQEGVTERTWSKTWTVRDYRLVPGRVELILEDVDLTALDALYPPYTYQVAEWDELLDDDLGRPVPVAVGLARKCRGALIDTNAGAGPWVYALATYTGTVPGVLTVYRSGRIVDPGEYTLGTATGADVGYVVRTVSFSAEPIDFSGRWEVIEADLRGTTSRNAVDEIERLVEAQGITVDAASFAAARAYAISTKMEVDCGYRRQRTTRAILTDLLTIARANLVRTSAGALALVQDRPRAVAATYVETQGDPVALEEIHTERVPATVRLRYGQGKQTPDDLPYELERAVTGGTGEQEWRLPYLSDHTAADRLLCYLEKRREAPKRATAG